MTTYIILAVVLFFVFYVIGVYNKFVRMTKRTEEAWQAIEVMLKRRYDLIPNLVETVKGYAKHEEGTLTKVIEARNAAMAGAHNPANAGQMEAGLAGALKSVFALSESYPDLKANQGFLSLQTELTDTENKVSASRQFYNANVRDLAIALDVFPGNIFAKMFGFTKKEFFDLPDNDAAQENVQVKF